VANSTGLEALGGYKEAIEAGLHEFFAEVPELLGLELSRYGDEALQHLEEFSLRPGKRIRGSLAALAYDCAAQTKHDPLGVRLGVALELVQTYLLIIDDVMDRSELRRGQPTLHVLYREQTGDTHQSDMTAITVGLLAQHLASLCVLSIDASDSRIAQVSALLQRNIAATAFGQLDDISQSFGEAGNEADIIRKYVLKSSYYTFVNPLQLGFALAGKASLETLQACAGYGIPAGVAFQLHDDYLGIFGNASKLGKASLDDIREGKHTLLIQYAFTHGDAAARKKLEAILGKQTAAVKDLQTVQSILETTGAKDYCIAQVKRYAAMSTKSLLERPVGNDELGQILASIVEYAVTREY
jgi:geranylgeranyl diphosphate synthase type I